MTEQEIKGFLNEHDYDVRKTNDGRWIDQKCTPDVVWSISDFVLDYIEKNGKDSTFTVKDIWSSDYAKEIVREEFSKPDTDGEHSANEFDKFFSQPLNLLCYAGIIKDISTTSRHIYKLSNYELLEYISRNDMYALRFLCLYIEKVLEDSGLKSKFDDFFEEQTNTSYNELKSAFEQFCYDNTKIKNKKETGRIFTKIINPLAYKKNKFGTEKGRISRQVIAKQDLVYNRSNFRDIYSSKPKNITRQEWLFSNPQPVNNGLLEHQMQSAQRQLRRFNDMYRNGASELTQFIDGHEDGLRATQVHHIFPKADYPHIKAFWENMILLTPNQHFSYAHPENNTQRVDVAAQKSLLIAKTCSIQKNLTSEDIKIYEFDNLLFVLSIGWNDEDVLEISDGDYLSVIDSINTHYANLF